VPGVELFLYADDTAIIFSAPDNAILQHNVTDFFVQYVHWCAANCIVVNSTKSYYLLFNDTDAVISIDGKLIERVQYAKYLGVYIDDKLMWSYHVAQVINVVENNRN
jgi:hypothetical protein